MGTCVRYAFSIAAQHAHDEARPMTQTRYTAMITHFAEARYTTQVACGVDC